MTINDDAVFAVLAQAFPGLSEGHFRIMKQTNHPNWKEAVDMAESVSTVGTYKISGLGWLCKLVNDKWIPLTKLTNEQLRECQFQ